MGLLSRERPLVAVAVGAAGARLRLLRSALDAVGAGAQGVTLHHACRRCGSEAHGRPYLRRAGRDLDVGVSVSSAGTVLALAVCPGHDVGLDLESVEAAGFDGYDDVVLHIDEPGPESVEARALLWVRKEACLKVLGSGLDLDPRELRLGPTDEDPVLLDRGGLSLVDLDLAPEGLVGCVAVSGSVAPHVTVLREGAAAPARGATT